MGQVHVMVCSWTNSLWTNFPRQLHGELPVRLQCQLGAGKWGPLLGSSTSGSSLLSRILSPEPCILHAISLRAPLEHPGGPRHLGMVCAQEGPGQDLGLEAQHVGDGWSLGRCWDGWGRINGWSGRQTESWDVLTISGGCRRGGKSGAGCGGEGRGVRFFRMRFGTSGAWKDNQRVWSAAERPSGVGSESRTLWIGW